MTDWADGIEIRNNGIKCVIDARILSELLRTIIALGLIAGALLFYSWVRSQIVYIGYETQNLFEDEEKLLDMQDNLIAEEETLTSPERIYTLATRDLGMTKLRPNQMILPPIQTRDRGIADSLAMVGSEADNLKNSKKRTLRNTIN
ncbi:MAG: cell division protein FtsL [Acidobacteria bacterium]|nr:cell division protein FtsL [Acidobacteriota bacterium]